MGSLSRIYCIKIEFPYKQYDKLLTKLRLLSKEYTSISGLRIRPEILEQTGWNQNAQSIHAIEFD